MSYATYFDLNLIFVHGKCCKQYNYGDCITNLRIWIILYKEGKEELW